MRIHFVCVCFNGYPDPAALSMCIRIRILNADPDPGGKMNADPDQQPWC